MSYESEMLRRFGMPPRKRVSQTLRRVLLKHGGVVKEFASGQQVVREIADELGLDQRQRSACLETVYRKEGRLKKSLLWHRLLFRAADALARHGLASRPTQTARLTEQREWMLTEKGLDEALRLCGIPAGKKESLSLRSYEVQKIASTLARSARAEDYDPFDRGKNTVVRQGTATLRARGFRQAVIDAYDGGCAICGLKIKSPDSLSWEVEAAHIVPSGLLGKDDLCNGIALCRLHHWAFDVGWLPLLDNYRVPVSPSVEGLPPTWGRIGGYECIRALAGNPGRIRLPYREEIYPHPNAMRWHRENVFYGRDR